MPGPWRALTALVPALTLLVPHAHAAPAAPAAAQPACDEYRELARVLGKHYAEAPVSGGLNADGSLLQIFAAPAAGTWTMVSVGTDGRACVVAVGRHWRSAAEAPAGDPA